MYILIVFHEIKYLFVLTYTVVYVKAIKNSMVIWNCIRYCFAAGRGVAW